MGTGLKIADERTLKNHELSYSAQVCLKNLKSSCILTFGS